VKSNIYDCLVILCVILNDAISNNFDYQILKYLSTFSVVFKHSKRMLVLK